MDQHHETELDRYGFTVVPGFSGVALDALRSLHDRHGTAPDDPQVALNWSFHSQSVEHKRTVLDDLIAAADSFLSSTFVDHVPYLATYITKWPGVNSGFAPHQDPSLVDERSFRGVTVWVPLQDTGLAEVDNGMLHVVPGSHLFSSALRSTDVDAFRFAPYEEKIVEKYGVGIGMSAGEALVFDNRIIHYSMPNETDVARVVVSFGMRPSVAACVLLRSGTDGAIDMHRIPDSFYIDVLPAQHHQWQPSGPPLATIPPPPEQWTAEKFDRRCREVHGRPTSVTRYSERVRAWSDPDAFCAFCGSSEGLRQGDRAGRNNAQLVCGSCHDRIAADSVP